MAKNRTSLNGIGWMDGAEARKMILFIGASLRGRDVGVGGVGRYRSESESQWNRDVQRPKHRSRDHSSLQFLELCSPTDADGITLSTCLMCSAPSLKNQSLSGRRPSAGQTTMTQPAEGSQKSREPESGLLPVADCQFPVARCPLPSSSCQCTGPLHRHAG